MDKSIAGAGHSRVFYPNHRTDAKAPLRTVFMPTEEKMAPFDADKLVRLMVEADLDLLMVNTRHNVRYLTGGYFDYFHQGLTRFATTRYLPLLVLPRENLQNSFLLGRPEETFRHRDKPLWVPRCFQVARGSRSAAQQASRRINRMGLSSGRIGIESPFFPADAFQTLAQELPHAQLVDSTPLLGRLRALKTVSELDILSRVTQGTEAAIQATFAGACSGVTTREIVQRLKAEMAARGVDFQWAITAVGPNGIRQRAPSSAQWKTGDVLRLDCGGAQQDYLADLSRMACLGEPSPLAVELNDRCRCIQDDLISRLRPGMTCSELHRLGHWLTGLTPFAEYAHFDAHGIGLVSHEPPEIQPENETPLETGMVLALETEFLHPEVGDVKIEDMVFITPVGAELVSAEARKLQVVN